MLPTPRHLNAPRTPSRLPARASRLLLFALLSALPIAEARAQDNTRPTITITINGVPFDGDIVHVPEGSTYGVHATDGESGLAGFWVGFGADPTDFYAYAGADFPLQGVIAPTT